MLTKKNSLLIVIVLIVITSCSKEPSYNEDEFYTEKDRIIAHAGGKIEGYTYTNSLEAMNLSYEKGCRLMELDILLTSDNKLVAAHGWKDFRNFTGYSEISDDPMTEEEFMSKTIWNKFTPMNMDMINEWFKNHKDAILVTDKINDPKLFCQHFLYKDRLIMELFSRNAIKSAQNEHIIPMISEYMFDPNIDDIEKEFIDLDVQYFATSLYFMFENRELLTRLKNRGVKTYIYSLNKQYDEEYILSTELDYVFGIYADNISSDLF